MLLGARSWTLTRLNCPALLRAVQNANHGMTVAGMAYTVYDTHCIIHSVYTLYYTGHIQSDVAGYEALSAQLLCENALKYSV